jgi:hypothetical protein
LKLIHRGQGATAAPNLNFLGGSKMLNLDNDQIVKKFVEMGFTDVEIIGGTNLQFSTGDDVINWKLHEAIEFLNDNG